MSFSVSGAYVTPVASPITINYDLAGVYTLNYVIQLGSLIGDEGVLVGDDQSGDGRIEAGETLDHDNTNFPFVDAIPDLNNATVLGVGTMSGLLLGAIVTYPVILVEQGGSQYLVFPDGPPGLLTSLTGTLVTTVRFYDGAGYAADGPVPCFTMGTLIMTDDGEKPIESLQPGDMVMTADHGLQELRWIGGRRVDAKTLEQREELRPIRIAAQCLGGGLPTRDLLVSPQHRVLVRSQIARRMFSTDDILISAKFLLAVEGIDVADVAGPVTYYHMLFDRHEVVFSNGAMTESLYAGAETIKMLTPAQRAEIAALFPELMRPDALPRPARQSPKGAKSRKLAERHAKNSAALVN